MNNFEIRLAKKNGNIDELYAQEVTKLIRARYSQNQIEAIINNYLDEPSNEKYLDEFNALQTYRKECKAKIKEELGIIE